MSWNPSKYQQTAERINDLDPFNVEMRTFTSVNTPHHLDKFRQANHECGTTFCIAGRLAHLDNFPEKFWFQANENFDFMAYSAGLCGHGARTNEWLFLFGPNWPDNLEAAKERARYVMRYDTCPPTETWVEDWELIEW